MDSIVGINTIVRRQIPESSFSHWEMDDHNLLALIIANITKGKQGYREGVLLVPLPPAGFFCPIVELKENDFVIGFYEKRREGEEPRLRLGVLRRHKSPAKSVIAVLYAHDVLAEDGDAETDCGYELVSINASLSEDNSDEPLKPGTLMANHFGDSGGTDTRMNDSDFVTELRRSHKYWQGKISIAGSDDAFRMFGVMTMNTMNGHPSGT